MQTNDTYTDRAAAPQRSRRPVPSTTSADGSPASLARTAAELGSTDALTARRHGSLKADLVQRLAKGTAGYDDEILNDYVTGATPPEWGVK